MANNRMYLTNKRTGLSIPIMRYYPPTGWYLDVTPDAVRRTMSAVDHADLAAAAGDDDAKAPYDTNVGDTSWVVEYEDGGTPKNSPAQLSTPSEN